MGFIIQPQTLFAIGPKRQFGGSGNIFSGYVTITENSTDAIEITQQPVQQGANIADHAFKKPISLSISDSFSIEYFAGNFSEWNHTASKFVGDLPKITRASIELHSVHLLNP